MDERSSKYWQERFRQMEDAQHDTSVQKAQEIQEQFDRSLAAIDGKINAWYQRLADNNGVSMQEARKMLDAGELKEFRWNVEEYTKYAEENEISGAWAKQLENASARVHISRLEALKIETQQEVEKLYGNCTDAIDHHIRDTYTSDFYHTAFEVQKGIGVGTAMNRLDPETVEKIVSKPWAVDGKNFSDRLWENKTKLINNMHNSLSRMCITGEAPDRAIEEISKQMGVSKAQAGRVVMTESAAFANKARQDCMEELDVEQFEVVETLDSHTCETCGGMDGKHFPMREFEVGVTAPPFHPNCRGCTCPYFDDEFDSVGERAARGEDGETYYIPADTTYGEWKKSFVDNGVSDEKFTAQNVVEEASTQSDIHKMNDNIEQKLFGKGIQVNIEGAGKYQEEAFEALKHLDKLTDEYENTVVSYSVGKIPGFQAEMGSAYMMNGKTSVLVSPRAYMANKATDALKLGEKQPLQTTYHEFAHSLSQSREKTDPQFWKEIRKIKREYEGIRGKSNWFDIKISDYASKDVDEFLAEAFTQAKLSDNPSLYSKQVLDVVDKYFKKQSTDGLAEMPDIKFATKKNSAITAKQKFQDTMTVSQAYNELPIKVKQNTSDVAFEFGYDGSACDIWNKTIRVGIGTSKEEVFHEMGHLVENYMMSQADVRKYKEFLVDGLSCNDIMVKTYYDNAGNDIEIYLLKGMNFESEYQSRLYVSNPFDALNGDGTINVDTLGEAISEVFRKYMNGETLSREAQELIEKVIL